MAQKFCRRPFLIGPQLTVKAGFQQSPGKALVGQFNLNAMRFEQTNHFTLASARQSQMTGKLLRTVDDPRFAKSG